MPGLHIVRRRPTTPRKGVWDRHLRDHNYNPDEFEALTDEELETYLAEDYSKLESAGYGLTRNIGGGIGGAAGMLGAGALASATGAGAVVGIPMMIGGAIASAVAGNAIQGRIEDAIFDDEERAQLQRNRREAELANPVSYFGGEMMPSLLAFKPSLTQLGKAGRGIGQVVGARGLEPATEQALKQSLYGAGLDTAIEGARQITAGDFDPGKLGLAATVGATLQKPTFKPRGVDELVKRGQERAAMRTKGSWFKPDEPSKVFNLWAEPLPTGAAYSDALETRVYSLYNQGKTYSGDAGTKVGIVENAATPTDSNLAFAIDMEVTRGVGILDPLKPGPAAQALGGVGGTRGAGIGHVPLTLEEVAAAQGVTPQVVRETYGTGAAKEAEIKQKLDNDLAELAKATDELNAAKNAPESVWSSRLHSYRPPQKPIQAAQTKVNKLEKSIKKAESQLADISDSMIPAEKSAIKKLFAGQAKVTEILDPITGRPRKVKSVLVPKEASQRIVDRNGEPLHERLDVWEPAGLREGIIRDPETGEVSQFLGVRMDDDGNFQRASQAPDGSVEWFHVSKAGAKKIRRQFEDHVRGVQKLAEDARLRLEREHKLATGKIKELPPLNMGVVLQLAKLALVRGFNLEEAASRIHLEGSTKAGFAAYDTRTVGFDPRRMGDDTIAHEGFHNFLDDLQYSTNPKDQKLRDDFIKLFDTEERGVEFLGRAMAARIARRKEATFKELLREARLRWKDKFGRQLTSKELKDYLLIKYERDHPFIFQSELMDGFLGTRGVPKLSELSESQLARMSETQKASMVSERRAAKEQLMEDVKAGRPVLAGSAISRVGVDDPWKNLKFQEEKKRYNSKGEEVVSEDRGNELFAELRKTLGMGERPTDVDPDQVARARGSIKQAGQDAGLKFQEVDAAYERALSENDTQALRSLTEQAAKLSGYNVRAFHGTPSKAEFDVFDYDKVGGHRGLRRPEVGLVHVTLHPKVAERISGKAVDVSELMGDLPSTAEAIAARPESLGTNVLNVYAKVGNPLHLQDTPGWDVSALESLVSKKATKVLLAKGSEQNAIATMAEHKKLTAISKELQELEDALVEGVKKPITDDDWVKIGAGTATAEDWSNKKRILEVANILKKHGYDSISYQNKFEMVKEGDTYFDLSKSDLQKSYMLFHENQIKSADPVVRDKETNEVIPLSQRFSRRESIKYQEARGERTVPDEGFLFAAGRNHARHMTETFDKFGTNLESFDPDRQVLSGGLKDRAWYNPVSWLRLIQYAAAETDQLLIRPFKGLQNSEITDATKNMALYARDAHNRLELIARRYVHRFAEPLVMRMKEMNLSRQERELLGQYRTLRRLVKKNYKEVDNEFMRQYNTEYQKLHSMVIGSRKLSDANKELDTLYVQTRDEHIANGPKQKVGDHWREPKEVQEGYYDPFMLSRDATSILKDKAHTKEGKDLQDKIINFWIKQRTPKPGLEDELRNDLAEYIAVLGNKDSYIKTTGETVDLTTASKFNALRKTEGMLMPPDLVDPDPFVRAQRYIGRFSKDMAWFTQIEDDHVMRAIRNLPDQEGNFTHRPLEPEDDISKPRTPTLKEIFGDDVDAAYGSRAEKTFRNLDETHAGFHTDWDINILRANRLVTSWWLGTMSGIRDTVDSFKNANIYMQTSDWPLILKSFTNLQDAWKQSHKAGANRSNPISQIEFAHDSVDRAADAMAVVADFSQKYSGRELFERGTRAIQFNLGKLLMRSYVNSASDSPHIKRVLATMGRVGDVDISRLRKNPESMTEADLHKLATAWVDVNQGTYGVRGVPSAMIRGKSSYFLSLSRWSVEKFNRYLKDVVMPIKTERDFKPFIKATLGSAVEGALLIELSNMVNAKESYEPSTSELFESDAAYEEFIYHAMHLANVSGYFGVLSGLANDTVRMFRTKKAGLEDVSAVTFPALEALLLDKGLAKSLFSYLRSGEMANPKAVLRLTEDVLTNLNQTLRIARNQILASSSTARGVDKALDTSYFKERSAEFNRDKLKRNLRVFNRLHRGEHTAGWFQNLDRYEKVPATAFKYSTTQSDMEENVRPFLESVWKRSLVQGKPDPNRFTSLLQQGYAKPENISPAGDDLYSKREARKFADFTARVRSKDAVRDIIRQEERDTLLANKRKNLIHESLPGFLAEKGYGR